MQEDFVCSGSFFAYLLMVALALAGDDSSPSTTPPPGPPKVKSGRRRRHNPRPQNRRSLPVARGCRQLRLPGIRARRNWLTPAAFSIHCRDATRSTSGCRNCCPSAQSALRKSADTYYFYTRREGTQNQPVLLVREGMHGKDRALVDANQMSADGTVALDWWFPSDDGKYVAYGTSASGSENSTLYVIETATGKLLPDTIERTRIAQVAWKKDNSGFYYGRNPKKGEVPEGEEVYHLHIFYHQLGTDPAKDPLILGRRPQ